MNAIGKFVYAAVLMLSAMNLAPGQASAQDAAGTFTLTHEVRWQNAVVPSGKYRFTMQSSGPNEVLALRKMNGHAASFVVVSPAEIESHASGQAQLALVSRNGEFCQHLAASRVRHYAAFHRAA
jgi:hypothetical protein